MKVRALNWDLDGRIFLLGDWFSIVLILHNIVVEVHLGSEVDFIHLLSYIKINRLFVIVTAMVTPVEQSNLGWNIRVIPHRIFD